MLPTMIDEALSMQASAVPNTRPEVPLDIIAQVMTWIARTDNLTQRENALRDFRAANQALFPAYFNINGQRRTPTQLRSGRDDRRVQVPYIYRDSLQTTAMTVPDDLDFKWVAREQVAPPADLTGGNPPTSDQLDPAIGQFGKTLSIVVRELLDEVQFIPKFQAWVQDSSIYSSAILKFTFRRSYESASLNPNPGDKDETDAVARLQARIQQFATGDFDENSADYADMLDLIKSIGAKARIEKWYGIDLQLVPLDAFGISEDCTDLVNIYDAPWMFHDALITGDELLAKYKFRIGEDGNSYGVLETELPQALPWDGRQQTTDLNGSRNRTSRNKQVNGIGNNYSNMSMPNAAGQQGVDHKKQQYLVREIWCKRDRKVYVICRGMTHYLDCFIPQKTSARWYPFAILAPNRVPGELYGESDLSLKRDIQARIHRKRSDEEKARWLSLERYVYNTFGTADEKEILKIGEIAPGQFKGINLGQAGAKITDMIMPVAYSYNPEAFNTDADMRDKDMMGALPTQALGATGTANFSSEVLMAGQGAQIAVSFRQAAVRRAIEGGLQCVAEILLQELSQEEAQDIAGPFALWPRVYDKAEADRIIAERKLSARKMMAPQVLQHVMESAAAGITIPPQEIKRKLDEEAAPLWQAEMDRDFGSLQPLTREQLYGKMKVKIVSTLSSRIDKQQSIQSLAMLAEAIMQMAQAAQGSGTPFNMRPILMQNAKLIGDEDTVNEAFPAISPLQLATALAEKMMIEVVGNAVGAGGKNPKNQGSPAKEPDPAGNTANGQASAPSTPLM